MHHNLQHFETCLKVSRVLVWLFSDTAFVSGLNNLCFLTWDKTKIYYFRQRKHCCASQKISKLKTGVIDSRNMTAFNIVITNATNSIPFHFNQEKLNRSKDREVKASFQFQRQDGGISFSLKMNYVPNGRNKIFSWKSVGPSHQFPSPKPKLTFRSCHLWVAPSDYDSTEPFHKKLQLRDLKAHRYVEICPP